MAELSTRSTAPPPNELDRMHDLYRRGGQERQTAPHIVYPEATCPHDGCEMPMQAIDFRLEDHGRAVHDPLVRAWWDDTGFAGRCPRCGGWIHFTIRGKRPIRADEAAQYPQLPDNWYEAATIL
jgi:hypothetical protein